MLKGSVITYGSTVCYNQDTDQDIVLVKIYSSLHYLYWDSDKRFLPLMTFQYHDIIKGYKKT